MVVYSAASLSGYSVGEQMDDETFEDFLASESWEMQSQIRAILEELLDEESLDLDEIDWAEDFEEDTFG